MEIHAFTLFPEMFESPLNSSILKRASEKGAVSFSIVDFRSYSSMKHKNVDDSPFGGGVGMVMTAEPVFLALEAAGAQGKRLLYMSPRGAALDFAKVQELSLEDELVVLCGHYEGVDERVLEYWNMEEISIGDYILTGGELAAMVMIDAVARMIKGVLGDEQSAGEESIYSGLLEYPQYTKPREVRGMQVPEVLFGGNHELIRLWKFEQSLTLTKKKRPDLFSRFIAEARELSKKERKILEKVMDMT
ncbi:MAG: tRNA (guanosine(37)-N1)-methyltransferase TrmD [Clostridiales bacterium]|nr:tRNA (guanosine(37)-N1)-methyltransferase TrmD [Clostridiales bacterium]